MKPLIRSLNEQYPNRPEIANAMYQAARESLHKNPPDGPIRDAGVPIAEHLAGAIHHLTPGLLRAFAAGWRMALAWQPWQQGATVPARPQHAGPTDRVIFMAGTGEPNRTVYVTATESYDAPVYAVYPTQDDPVGYCYQGPMALASALTTAMTFVSRRLREGGLSESDVRPLTGQ